MPPPTTGKVCGLKIAAGRDVLPGIQQKRIRRCSCRDVYLPVLGVPA